MYYRARYYSPSQQRFISQDPLGFGGGDVNLYAYVANGATNAVDPTLDRGRKITFQVKPEHGFIALLLKSLIGGRRSKLSPQQQAEIRKMVSKGECPISALMAMRDFFYGLRGTGGGGGGGDAGRGGTCPPLCSVGGEEGRCVGGGAGR